MTLPTGPDREQLLNRKVGLVELIFSPLMGDTSTGGPRVTGASMTKLTGVE